MTDIEKLNTLVGLLEGGNAARLARNVGIRTERLSRARHGRAQAKPVLQLIVKAYPEVNKEWLLHDEGEPLTSSQEKNEILRRLDEISRQIQGLTDRLDRLSAD